IRFGFIGPMWDGHGGPFGSSESIAVSSLSRSSVKGWLHERLMMAAMSPGPRRLMIACTLSFVVSTRSSVVTPFGRDHGAGPGRGTPGGGCPDDTPSTMIA